MTDFDVVSQALILDPLGVFHFQVDILDSIEELNFCEQPHNFNVNIYTAILFLDEAHCSLEHVGSHLELAAVPMQPVEGLVHPPNLVLCLITGSD